ncbi:MAG: P-II family nitrogen regulator [Firmicutes bacterium]|nr:P-II family nitrogen regulator [Bacillota bacterium]
MKKIEIVVNPGKVEVVKNLLISCGVGGAMFSNISGFGTQQGKTYVYNGVTYEEHVLPKIKIETVIDDELVPVILSALSEVATGKVGDGKVFVQPVDDAMRIRTGEKGLAALRDADDSAD